MASLTQERDNLSISGAAILARNCAKSYGNLFDRLRRKSSPPVFSGLNINVPTGKIYVLLGIGSSGKSTLLRCITGQCRIESGSIEIFGENIAPGNHTGTFKMGYMPQETRMFSPLTIEETLKYHGSVAGLSNDYVIHRIKLLTKHLKLPKKSKQNDKLSVSEQRMLTFAVSVLQEPSLLILDEPTLNMDLISRHRIRNYLRYLVDQCSTTVMLATQLSEEANNADFVGILDSGQILAEGPPNDLLNRWRCLSLNEIDAKMLPKDVHSKTVKNVATLNKNGNIKELDIWQHKPDNNCFSSKFVYTDDPELELETGNNCHVDNSNKLTGFPRLSRIMAEFTRNIILLTRFRLVLVLLIGLPLLHLVPPLLGIGTSIGGINVGFLNDDNGIYGSWYLSSLNPVLINLIQQPSFQDGYHGVHSGKTTAFVYIGRNFSQYLLTKYTDATSVTVDIINEGLVNLTMDTSVMQVTFELMREVMGKIEKLYPKAFVDKGQTASLGAPPIKVNWVPEVLLDYSFTALVVPIQLVIVPFITQVGCSLLFLFERRRRGYCENLESRINDFQNIEIFVGFAINQIIIALVQTCVAFAVVFLFFKFPIVGSFVTAVIISIFVGFSGMALGIFLSTITTNMVAIIILGFFGPTFVSHNSGMIVPVEAMPIYLKYIFKASPFYFPADALTCVLYRGFGFFNMEVMLSLTASVIWILIFLFLAFVALRIRSK